MRWTLLFFLLLTMLGWAQPTTPTVFVNEKFTLVELAKFQRATLRYDLAPIRGEHLMVKLYRHDQTFDEEPLKTWMFHGTSGSERISFNKMPLAVYTLLAFCCNEEGEALAYAAPLIHVQYGGWRAWEAFKPPVEEVKKNPTAFEEVTPATKISNRDVGIAIAPRAVVLRPGQSTRFKAVFRNMEPEPLKWDLVGDGKLEAIEDGVYKYTAPAEQVGTKLFRLEIKSSAHPDLQGGATVLVTTADDERLE